MAKGAGSVRAQAGKVGLTLRKLPFTGGRDRYSISGPSITGLKFDLRAPSLKAASKLISMARKQNLRGSNIVNVGKGGFQLYRKTNSFGDQRLVGQFPTRRAATAAAARGVR